jgi:hypothetical protein
MKESEIQDKTKSALFNQALRKITTKQRETIRSRDRLIERFASGHPCQNLSEGKKVFNAISAQIKFFLGTGSSSFWDDFDACTEDGQLDGSFAFGGTYQLEEGEPVSLDIEGKFVDVGGQRWDYGYNEDDFTLRIVVEHENLSYRVNFSNSYPGFHRLLIDIIRKSCGLEFESVCWDDN